MVVRVFSYKTFNHKELTSCQRMKKLQDCLVEDRATLVTATSFLFNSDLIEDKGDNHGTGTQQNLPH